MPRYSLHAILAASVTFGLMFQATWTLAGTTGGLLGNVVEAGTTRPIANAIVQVTSPSQSASAQTDASGHFTFLSLAPDTYTVSVQKQGYDDVSQQGVNVIADATQSLTLATKKTLREIGRVSSRSSALVKPGQVSDVYSVTPEQQAASAALGGGGNLNTAYSAISSVPGTYVPAGSNGQAQSIYVRGGDYTEVSYEYDGVPVQRSFDAYPSNSLSALGQQELQVYTGSPPASSAAEGLSGYVNQVIKSGTYPGFGTLELGIGGPGYYHKAQIEAGGATPNRLFSYYVALAGYNHDNLIWSRLNGSDLLPTYGSAYNLIKANCGTPSATTGCYANTLFGGGGFNQPIGPNGIVYGPISYGGGGFVNDRESIVNLHFGVPHKKDNGRDDIQLLYDTSLLITPFQAGLSFWGAQAADVANGTITTPSGVLATCGSVNPSPCAKLGGNIPSYFDSQLYTGPVNSVLTAANLTQTVPYLYPGSPRQRQLFANIDPNQADGTANSFSILKLQYQKNISSNAYFRIFGYSFYSDALSTTPALLTANLVGGSSPDYSVISHTRGVTATFADQINPKHLLNLTGQYVNAPNTRDNQGITLPPSLPIAYLVSSGNPSAGCYLATAPSGGLAALSPCASASMYIFGPAPPSSASPGSPLVTGSVTDPTVATASSVTCGGSPCEYLATDSGSSGRFNTVRPIFSSLSLQDTWRPSDKLVVNLGLRYDDFKFKLPQTTGGIGRALLTNDFNAYHCFNPTLKTIEAADPATATCPAGDTHTAFNTTSPTTQDYTSFQPRLGFTFTPNASNVYRFSFGKYVQPPASFSQQYDSHEANLASADSTFYGLGFTTPGHPVRPETTYNVDASWEHQIKGTDTSFSISPFYRYAKDEILSVLIDPIQNFVSGVNAGNEKAYGVEFLLRKGDFKNNGFAGQLAYTYTRARSTFSTLQNGNSVVLGVNNAISAYNAFTATGGGAACYTPATSAAPGSPAPGCGAGTVANPYFNDKPRALLDPGASYIPFDQFPSAGPSGVQGSFVVPHVLALILNYKHDRLAITPTFQLSAGTRYGSPTSASGIDPTTCTGVLAASPAGDPRYPYGPPSGGSAYDAQTCSGSIVIPDPFTRKFDELGAFTEPTQLLANVQIAYSPSPRVKLVGTLANVINTCFGGSQQPWVQSHRICGYNTGFSGYVGNFFNPGNQIQPTVAYPYGPLIGLQPQGIAVGSTSPFQTFLAVQIKL